MKQRFMTSGRLPAVLSGAAVLLGLYVISLYHYLLFHSLAELFSIAIGLSLFILAWNSRHILENNYFLFIGIAYLSVSMLDLFHTLSYNGMGVFAAGGTNQPTQLWIAARLVQSVSFFAALHFLKRRLNATATFLIFTAITGVLLSSIYIWGIFPTCYIEGTGLTPFKIVTEYSISSILLISLVLLYKNRSHFDETVLKLIAASIVLTIGSELAFAQYINIYGPANLIGHFLKIIAFSLIYKALVETGFVQPYKLLFRDLIRHQETLQEEKEKAQGYLDVAGAIIVVLNVDQSILLINKKGREILEYEEKYLVGKNWFDTVLPERLRDGAKNAFMQIIAGNIEGADFSENTILTRSGKERLVRWHNGRLKDEHGRVACAISSGEDITEQKLAEEKLRASEAQIRRQFLELQAIYDSAAVGLYVLDRTLRYLRINHRMAEINGVMVADHIGKTPKDIVPDLAPAMEELAESIFRTSKPVLNIEFSGTTPAQPGVRRTWLESWLPLTDTGGQIIGISVVAEEVTERKRVEEALRESEKRYHALFEAMTEGFAIHEIICNENGRPSDYRFLDVNPAFERLTGLKRKDVIGKIKSEVLPDDDPSWIETYGAVALTGWPIHFENYSSALKRHYEVFAYCPAPRQFATVFMDVSERKLAEEKIRNLAKFPAENPYPVLRLNQDGIIMYANEKSQDLLRNWQCKAGGRAPGSWRDLVRDAVTHQSPRTIDMEYGEYVYSFVIAPVTDTGYANIYGRDITEYRQIVNALRESEERFRVAITKSPISVFNQDKDLRYTWVYNTMDWYPKDEIVGKTDADLMSPESASRLTAIKRQVLEQGKGNRTEVMIQSRGKSFYHDLTVEPLFDSSGDITGITCAALDITTSKQAEMELKKRTTQLENANRELESFSYSVSHDLRAPLRAIDGYSRMILKNQTDKFDEDTKQKFGVIRSNTQMMGKLIDDLLSFSRLGRKDIAMSKIDMDSLIRDVWQELQIINPGRNMKLKIKNMSSCHGDRLLIKQVCLNLLSNAIKFTKFKKIAHIEVGECIDGNEIEYCVKDNGIGFDMAYYGKLFGVFQRLHSADDFEGTGVGLAIVQRIIHRHGGRVWADGKIDQGACFYFSLTRKE